MFLGSTPMTVNFVKVHQDGPFRKLRLQVANQSNKDIYRAECNFVYLDEAGRTLGRDWASLSVLNPRVDVSLLVKSSETNVVDELVSEIPENVADVKFAKLRVCFADNTFWEGAPDDS